MNVIEAAKRRLNDIVDDDLYEPLCSKNSSICHTPPQHVNDSKRVTIHKAIGKGTFGTVFEGTLDGNIEVAVKQITPNRAFREREVDILQTMTEIPHKNVIKMLHHCAAEGGKVWMVMNLYPTTIYDAACVRPSKMTTRERARLVQRVAKQLLSGLEHIHALNIMHRDLKPLNILWDPDRHHLVIADFGASKKHDSKPSTTYIATRYYRAPECILDNPNYDYKIDIWAAGCILAEIIQAKVLFEGRDSTDQLYKILRRMGYPSNEELACINPELSMYTEWKPKKQPYKENLCEWILLYGRTPKKMSTRTSKILECLLCLSPKKRKDAGEVVRVINGSKVPLPVRPSQCL